MLVILIYILKFEIYKHTYYKSWNKNSQKIVNIKVSSTNSFGLLELSLKQYFFVFWVSSVFKYYPDDIRRG